MQFSKNRRGILIILALLLLSKIALYYTLMDIQSNFVFIYFLTVIYISILFLFFENKRIASVIYLLSSVLMFMDVSYFSYFNRNLSITMIEAAGFLGNVTDSIFEVVKPLFLLLVIDAIFIIMHVFLFPKSTMRSMEHLLNRRRLGNIKTILSVFMICMISFISLNGGQSELLTSINNQEFFTYHLKDILFQDQETEAFGVSEIIMDTDRYENNERDELFGIAKGRNLIVIQVESLQDMVINKEYNGQAITPHLNELIKHDSLYFDHYYQQLGSGNTSDAEFVSQNSLYASFRSYTYSLYTENYFHGLPWILKDLGYNTMAFHGYKKDFWNRKEAYAGQGFDHFFHEDDFEIGETIGFGLSDIDFFNQSVNFLKESPQPFYGFFITLSCHHPYEMPDQYKKIRLKEEDEGTLFGNYLHGAYFSDVAIGKFIQDLKANGLYENAVIAIYGDHFGLNCKEEDINKSVGRFLGGSYDYDEMMNIPLIIHIPGLDISRTINTTGGQIDFLPTVAYLLGVDKLDTLYFGQNLINAETGFVASQTYMPKGSFIQDNIIYEMPRDGVFVNGRAWDINTGEPVDLELCKSGYKRAVNEVNMGNFILQNDVLREIFLENKTIEEMTEVGPSSENVIISRGGDILEGNVQTNSKEALEEAYINGAKYIEVSFEWTSDGYPVLVKDWDESMPKLFGQQGKRFSLEEFKNLKMINGWHQMTLDDLIQWIRYHQDVMIIPEIKTDSIKFLKILQEQYPEYLNKFIPQMNRMDEFTRAEYLGYPNIIFKVEENSVYTNREILYFVMLNNVFAVALPEGKIESDYHDLTVLEDKKVYAYTVNDARRKKSLEEIGVTGFYTDEMDKLKE